MVFATSRKEVFYIKYELKKRLRRMRQEGRLFPSHDLRHLLTDDPAVIVVNEAESVAVIRC